MQEEVAKHTKKIYHAVKDPNHTFMDKLKEIGIEIFIIVFAVTLSIWLHSWSDHRHEQKEVSEFLSGLKDDLNNDIHILEENRADIAKVGSGFTYLEKLCEDHRIDTASDGTVSHYLYFALKTTHPNIGRYEGFKSSGKLGAIENDCLKQRILVYYQQTMPGVADGETLVNDFQAKILDLEIGKTDKNSLREIVKTFKMRALLQLATDNIKAHLLNYDQAIKDAKKIISMIDHLQL